jgi:uncharacterized membrane protein YraQ (UPF0718 family)
MSKQDANKSYGGWLFLALVLCAYGALGLIKPESTKASFHFFVQIMGRMLPVLGLVFVLLYVTNLALRPALIKRYLGRESGIKGWVASVVGGIFSMGPVYPWYAVLAELRQKGMRDALVAAFLYSRAVKLPLLPLMIHYFGLVYTLILCLYLVVFSMLNGIVVEKMTRQKFQQGN